MNPTRNEADEMAMLDYTEYWGAVEKDAQTLYHHLENGVSGETNNKDVFKRACELSKGIQIGSGKTVRLFENNNGQKDLYDQTWIFANLHAYGSIIYKSSKSYI